MNAAVASVELELARVALAALGHKPPGHPRDFENAARVIRTQAKALETAARATGDLPASMDYSGPQAAQFAGHAAGCASVCGHATAELGAIASDLDRQGSELHKHQLSWQRMHDGLTDKIRVLAAAVARGD
jgi:hypothetical protein